MTFMYKTRATAHGGRAGKVESEDGRLRADLTVPKELGGGAGTGTNPEQLFAAGYAACFESALRLVARRRDVTLDERAGISAEVGLIKKDDGAYGLHVALTGLLPGLAAEEATDLMEAAHQVCPYSNATRGNIEVLLHVALE